MTELGRLDMTFVRVGLAARAAELALALLGEPNRSMSSKRDLRFGQHGSISVVITGRKAGMWHDHQVGAGGDMLGLIMREHRGSFRDAIEFAERFVGQAPVEPAPAPPVRQSDDAAEGPGGYRPTDVGRRDADRRQPIPAGSNLRRSHPQGGVEGRGRGRH